MAMKATDQKAIGRGGGGGGVDKNKKNTHTRVEGRGGRSQTQKNKKRNNVLLFFLFASGSSPLPSTFFFWLRPPPPPPPPPPRLIAEVYFGAQDTTNRSRNISILWDTILYTQRYNLKVRLISSKSYVKWVCLCQCLLKRLISCHINSTANSKLHKECS